MGIFLPALLPLLSKFASGFVAKPILDLVSSILGASDPKGKALAYFQARVNAQIGRTAGKELAHEVLKQIEDGQNPANVPGTADQRVAIGQALAEATAVAYAKAGEALLSLQSAQGAVERARDAGGAALDAARKAREAAELVFVQANLDIARHAAGYSV